MKILELDRGKSWAVMDLQQRPESIPLGDLGLEQIFQITSFKIRGGRCLWALINKILAIGHPRGGDMTWGLVFSLLRKMLKMNSAVSGQSPMFPTAGEKNFIPESVHYKLALSLCLTSLAINLRR